MARNSSGCVASAVCFYFDAKAGFLCLSDVFAVKNSINERQKTYPIFHVSRRRYFGSLFWHSCL